MKKRDRLEESFLGSDKGVPESSWVLFLIIGNGLPFGEAKKISLKERLPGIVRDGSDDLSEEGDVLESFDKYWDLFLKAFRDK